MKTIDVIRKGNPESPAYFDSVAIIEGGDELYTGAISVEPNPYQPCTLKPWEEIYCRVIEGDFGWKLIAAHRKFGRRLLINNGAAVQTLNPNNNHNREYYATGIYIHKGDSMTWRGSAGCLTVPPDFANRFFNIFGNNETGKLTIRKVHI